MDTGTAPVVRASASDAAELRRRLAAEIEGAVRFDVGTRTMYATDASNYAQMPIGVVEPRTAADVAACLAICRDLATPVLPRGAGTSLAGQACNVAVILDFTRHMNKVVALDATSRLARVEPGVVLDRLQDAARPHGLVFGPDPATHGWCTLGGMIGNNASGAHSLVHGKTADHVHELDVITYRGSLLKLSGTVAPAAASDRGTDRDDAESIGTALSALAANAEERIRHGFPQIQRRVSGYNLDFLLPEAGPHVARALVGSEGTCAVVLEATVSLVAAPGPRVLVVLGFPDIAEAADAVPAVLAHGPVALEGIEARLFRAAGGTGLLWREPSALDRHPNGGLLLVELEGVSVGASVEAADRLACDTQIGAVSARVASVPEEQRLVWSAREAALGSASRALGGRLTWPGWEDSAVAPEVLGDYLRDLRRLMGDHGFDAALYGHFGEGCVHGRVTFDFDSSAGLVRFRQFMEEAARLVVRYGGCLSGEHGDGQARGELLGIQFDAALMEDFRRFKAIWDPDGLLNPGKLIDARPLDADLRTFQKIVDPPPSYAQIAAGAAACVGVGRCRKAAPGTMCPSFMATGDEAASTRGRARLLIALTTGQLPDSGRARLDEALELCLGCKACRTECPAGVDMAALKSDYRAENWAGRPRPRLAVISAFLPWMLRVPAPARGLARLVVRNTAAARLAGRAAGMVPGSAPPIPARTAFMEHRSITQTHADKFSVVAAPDNPGPPTVVLWPDTMHNYFHPDVLDAAMAVLLQGGSRVAVPRSPVCCGRTLVDAGFTHQARSTLLAAAEVLSQPALQALPLVVLEPSCLAMFRHELGREPGLAAASARRRAVGFAEYLANTTSGPAVTGRARPDRPPGASHLFLQTHCHQQALWGSRLDATVLADAGYVVQQAPDGCCGMAGTYGLAPRTAAVGRAVGELALLPAVRGLAPETLIVADGFSCREQIRRATGRVALHSAQALRMGASDDGQRSFSTHEPHNG